MPKAWTPTSPPVAPPRACCGRSTIAWSTRDLDLVIQTGARHPAWKTLDDLTWELRLRQGVTLPQRRAVQRRRGQVQLRALRRSRRSRTATRRCSSPSPTSRSSTRYTVRVKTSEPFAELIETLAWYVEMLPPKAGADPAAMAKKPIGTGPYKFVSWTPERQVRCRSGRSALQR